jgi:hypothetical protein
MTAPRSRVSGPGWTTRDETAGWNATNESQRDEARLAIPEAARAAGGADLRDHRGLLVERID